MATIAAAAIVAGGAAYAANASSKSAGKQNDMIKEQIEEARRIRRENKNLAEGAYTDIDSLITNLPGIQDFLSQGEEIGKSIQTDRLKSILGDSEADVRKSLGINAQLGAYDFSGLTGNLAKVVQGNLFDISSLTRDSAAGTFANVSVANMASLAQMGLNNTINTGDFLGRISGIDQFNPYRVAQDLFTVEQGRTNSRIQNTQNRVNTITEQNNQWFNNFSDLSNAQMVVEANRTAAQISAVNTITSTAAGAVTGVSAKIDQKKQQDYYQNLMKGYGQP